MQLRQLFSTEEERAVSPVIGVILMVAITVILAAVIGTFVLGLGDQVQDTAPNSQFSFDYEQVDSGHDSLAITHDGGDAIRDSRISGSISGAQAGGGAARSWEPSTDSDDFFGAAGSQVTAGSSYTVDGSHAVWDSTPTNLDLSESTIRVVWTSQSGDQSSTVARWKGPDA